MTQDLCSSISKFIEKEKLGYKISKKSHSDFWIESLKGHITVRVLIDNYKKRVYHDINSSEDGEHLHFESIKDIERREFLEESRRNWKSEIAIEEIWLILDEIKLWAFKNKYFFTDKELI